MSMREIRSIVDPLIMKLRQELYGSGISFGNIAQSKLPPSVVVVDGGGSPSGGGTDVDTLGYIKGITTYSGGLLAGVLQTELNFVGFIVSVSGARTTISGGTGTGGGSPLTVRELDGSPSISNVTEIVVSGGSVVDNGGGSATIVVSPHIVFREADGSPSFNASEIIVPPGSLQMSGATAAKLGFPRTVGWYIDGSFAATTDIGPNIIMDVPVTITGIRLYCKTVPSGGIVEIDVQKSSNNGTSYSTIYSTRPKILAGERVGGYDAILSTTTLVSGEILRLDIISANSARSLTASLFMVTF